MDDLSTARGLGRALLFAAIFFAGGVAAVVFLLH